MDDGKWCWADSGYHLTKWLILPYKQPANQIRENRTFNYHLSKICIQCEHTIGYLKSRFQSLKELRVRIKNAEDLAFAIAWINACIMLHAFCMDQELEINQGWLRDGQKHEHKLQTMPSQPSTPIQLKDTILTEGKQVRKNLKQMLLDAQ